MQSIVTVEDDPTPIVLILATTLRRSERTPKLAAAMRRASGAVALMSTVDRQAATIHFRRGTVHLTTGVADPVDVVIAADLNAMAEPEARRPKVIGAARHPLLALTAARALDPPLGTWREEAQRFWDFACLHPGVPRGMRVVCTDDGTESAYGAAPAEFEVHGSAHRLRNVFAGTRVLGQDLFEGKLYVVGALRHTAEMTGRSLAWMMSRS